MKSVFNHEEQEELKERLANLNENSTSKWGKMDVAQMCHHCALALDINSGRVEEAKPGFMVKLFKPMIKKVVFGPQPYKKGGPTAPQFVVKDKKEFQKEYEYLLEAFAYYTNPAHKEIIVAHPSKVYGRVSEADKGWAMYKHLDHHLQQFGL